MTTKTDITLPPLPGALIDVETEARAYARAAVEADRQGRMPSDAEILACLRPLYSNDVAAAMGAADDLRTAHLLLSRYGSGQPADDRAAYESGRRVGLGFAHSVVSEIRRKHVYRSGIDGLNTLVQQAADVIAREKDIPTTATTDDGQPTAPVAQEPAAEVLSNRKGNDTSTIDKALPAGTKLYVGPVAAQAQPTMPQLTDAMRAVLRNEHCVYDSEDDLYAALCDAAQAQSSGNSGELGAQDREDAERLDWLDGVAHCADWLDGEPIKRVIRASDGVEFTGDTWREAIDAARAAKGADHG